MNAGAGKEASSELMGGRFLVLKSDLTVSELEQALVAEGDAKDVRGEVLESGGAGADCLAVNHPILVPDARVNRREQAALFQGVSHLGPEDDCERTLVQ